MGKKDPLWMSLLVLTVVVFGPSVKAARFRHPLTVSDMSTFASPHNYGSYGYGYMSGAGTPERYSDLANRYAYRTKSYEPEVEEVASELNELPVVARRSLSDSYYTRKLRREKELSALFEKIASQYPDLANQMGSGNGKKLSLDNLFGLTVFGQPRMGKK